MPFIPLSSAEQEHPPDWHVDTIKAIHAHGEEVTLMVLLEDEAENQAQITYEGHFSDDRTRFEGKRSETRAGITKHYHGTFIVKEDQGCLQLEPPRGRVSAVMEWPSINQRHEGTFLNFSVLGEGVETRIFTFDDRVETVVRSGYFEGTPIIGDYCQKETIVYTEKSKGELKRTYQLEKEPCRPGTSLQGHYEVMMTTRVAGVEVKKIETQHGSFISFSAPGVENEMLIKFVKGTWSVEQPEQIRWVDEGEFDGVELERGSRTLYHRGKQCEYKQGEFVNARLKQGHFANQLKDQWTSGDLLL